MAYSVFIDFPDDLNSYEFFPGEKYGADVVSRLLGIKVEFVCNHYARISDGDIYEVPFENLEDVTAFILKCKYNLVHRDKIEEYKNRKK